MFDKVLVATDLSMSSEELIEHVVGLKALGTREILLVRCFNLRDVGPLADDLMENARKPLLEQGGKLERAGFAVQTNIVTGLPQKEINQLAAETGCQLVVVGEQRHTLAGEILFDEMAGAISHYSKLPVLVMRVHPSDRSRAETGTAEKDLLRHVLFSTDFSDHAENAFSLLEREIIPLGVRKVTIIHVQHTLYLHDVELTQETLDQFKTVARDRLQGLQQRLQQAQVPEVEVELLHGTSPKREVLRRIKRSDDDISLVIMGSQGHGFFSELFLGSVSHAVARRSEAPTLLVPMNR